jgi:molybdopterin/thiamine biosynthesis adenylyltransferase
VGEGGQAKLLNAKVLCIGAGGLGCPAALYLAAAGVGTIGLVDMDVVDLSNLQRQILHTNDRVGMPKTESAKLTLQALNPDVKVIEFRERLSSENAFQILSQFDVVVNGCDNFYALPGERRLRVSEEVLVDGAIWQFEGQTTVSIPTDLATAACSSNHRRLAPCSSCAELAARRAPASSVLPGAGGDLILGQGKPLYGRLLHSTR